MNYGQLKEHFNDLLNRSDITSTLTTRFIDQGIARIQRQLRTPLNEKKKDFINKMVARSYLQEIKNLALSDNEKGAKLREAKDQLRERINSKCGRGHDNSS